MISGAVVSGRGPVVPLVVLDADGHEHTVSAIVDTGFNGWLTLPRRLAHLWGLSLGEQGSGVLANGTAVSFEVYEGQVVWDGQPTAVLVDEMESEPLIGMRLTRGYRMLIENVDGGVVTIERMP
jgi:clan AA aspartic protease